MARRSSWTCRAEPSRATDRSQAALPGSMSQFWAPLYPLGRWMRVRWIGILLVLSGIVVIGLGFAASCPSPC